VWDVCEARFSVYEEIENDVEGVGKYGDAGREGEKVVVGIRCREKAGEGEVKNVQSDVVEMLKRKVGGGDGTEMFSSVYRHAADEAHPDGHPDIGREEVGGGEWLVLVLVVSSGEEKAEIRKLEEVLGEWANGREVRVGVWAGELDMV
jgi:hypothetical protein